jgi:hypothetical protein
MNTIVKKAKESKFEDTQAERLLLSFTLKD